ncbi:MAG: DNA-directed RNA polymerase subunit omega [candidate division Zixibacteria bacterium]|nr:DNA-directed RNA polymerase subunit omega [candidate division Zixibacteria bacterium]
MDLSRIEELNKICKNRYAAILVASKHARKLNTQLLAQEGVSEKKSKVTVQAIKDLLGGKINYEYPSTKSKSMA